ncbi:MAG TPA: site-2 protease family protein [Nostocaceae cyanobacterium]|nr:site-2 protease family protein [Nostocaceae cyanobacterium]
MFIYTLTKDPILFVRVVAIVILSICLHELAHGFAAISQGDDTPRKTGHMTLNPIVHMGWHSIIYLFLFGISWGQMPVNPSKFRHPKYSNILVSAAGPLSNLVLSLIFLTIWKFTLDNNISTFFSEEFLYLGASINIHLMLFNLLPIPPLDGFHIYSELFPDLKRLENTQFGLFALMLVFILPQFGEGLNQISTFIIGSFLGGK